MNKLILVLFGVLTFTTLLTEAAKDEIVIKINIPGVTEYASKIATVAAKTARKAIAVVNDLIPKGCHYLNKYLDKVEGIIDHTDSILGIPDTIEEVKALLKTAEKDFKKLAAKETGHAGIVVRGIYEAVKLISKAAQEMPDIVSLLTG